MNMRNLRNLLIALVITGLVAPVVSAKFIAFERMTASVQPGMKAGGSAERFTIDIAIPGIEVTEEGEYSVLRIPGHAISREKDAPELPVVTTSVLLPDKGKAEAKLVGFEETTLEVGKIAPARGRVTRDIDISTVARVEGAAYKTDAFYPSESYKVELDKPYICRDVRGAALRISPVRYNPVTGKVHVMTKATIEVGVKDEAGENEKVRKGLFVDADFAPVYKKLYINHQIATKNWTDINENVGRAIIITPDEFVENLAPLQEWRATKGLESKVVPVSQFIGEGQELTGETLKAYIASEYEAGNLTWVLLIGDADLMPTLRGANEGAHSDACLVKLEGDDHIPDAFISRFSCKTAEELDVQVARTVKYEKEPVTGEAAAFYRKATGIASNQGNPTDKVRADWLRDIELAWHYDHVDQIYDPSANQAKVAEALTEGRGLVNYIGHGSKTMWVSSRFNVSDVAALQNTGGKWPMIWSVACVNGDFANGSDCFGEAWAKAGTAADPRGAIGIVAASTNMAWVPPCVWQKAIVEDYMAAEVVFTGGAQHHYGCLKACEEYGYQASSDGVQIVEQCIYFGDGTVVLRNDIPAEATVTVETCADRSLTLKVVAGDKPVKAARVVVSTELQGGMVGTTDENGIVKVESKQDISRCGTVSVTVTGPNLLPLINESVEVGCDE